MSTILLRSNGFPLGALRASVTARAPNVNGSQDRSSIQRAVRSSGVEGLVRVELAARPRDDNRVRSMTDAELLEDVVHVVLHRRNLDP